MTIPQEVVNDIASRIRKIEDILDMQRKINQLLSNEVKCLHTSLNHAAHSVDVSVDESAVTVFGGGTPKNTNP